MLPKFLASRPSGVCCGPWVSRVQACRELGSGGGRLCSPPKSDAGAGKTGKTCRLGCFLRRICYQTNIDIEHQPSIDTLKKISFVGATSKMAVARTWPRPVSFGAQNGSSAKKKPCRGRCARQLVGGFGSTLSGVSNERCFERKRLGSKNGEGHVACGASVTTLPRQHIRRSSTMRGW